MIFYYGSLHRLIQHSIKNCQPCKKAENYDYEKNRNRPYITRIWEEFIIALDIYI